MQQQDKCLFDIDRAIKVFFGRHAEKSLDLLFGPNRQIIFQGVEDPQINIAERRADKVWLIADHGQDAVLHMYLPVFCYGKTKIAF